MRVLRFRREILVAETESVIGIKPRSRRGADAADIIRCVIVQPRKLGEIAVAREIVALAAEHIEMRAAVGDKSRAFIMSEPSTTKQTTAITTSWIGLTIARPLP